MKLKKGILQRLADINKRIATRSIKLSDEALEEIQLPASDREELIKELTEQTKLGITRSDYVETMVKALLRLHPEVYDNPEVAGFFAKLAKYEERGDNG